MWYPLLSLNLKKKTKTFKSLTDDFVANICCGPSLLINFGLKRKLTTVYLFKKYRTRILAYKIFVTSRRF